MRTTAPTAPDTTHPHAGPDTDAPTARRRPARRVTRAAFGVLVPALLFTATACGGAADPSADKGPGPAGSRPAEGSAPPAGALPATSPSPGAAPATGLAAAALAQGDVPGYQISAQGKNPNAPSGQPQADKKQCQPLADVMGDKPDAGAAETVNRGIGSQKQLGLAVSASLSEYPEAAAKALMTRLRAAVAACGTGFTATVEKQTGAYRDVKPVEFKPAGGDETVSWSVTAAAAGVSAPVHLVVIREGATVVRLMALNVAGAPAPAPGAQAPAGAERQVRVPRELADKQLEKLARVSH
ncbi:hypothetical protein ACN20G_08495 [Streptomyces sp. BI20]|uniref:hypothetical protein n=1 Tax=Streptomyces sp. BI20 TaxID=3403460 RepID=UPI003C7848FC